MPVNIPQASGVFVVRLGGKTVTKHFRNGGEGRKVSKIYQRNILLIPKTV